MDLFIFTDDKTLLPHLSWCRSNPNHVLKHAATPTITPVISYIGGTSIIHMSLLVGEHVDKANGEHSSPRTVPLDLSLHPVFIVRLLVQHDQDFTLLKLQLVVVIRVAIIQSSASPVATHQGVHLQIEPKSILLASVERHKPTNYTYKVAIIQVVGGLQFVIHATLY